MLMCSILILPAVYLSVRIDLVDSRSLRLRQCKFEKEICLWQRFSQAGLHPESVTRSDGEESEQITHQRQRVKLNQIRAWMLQNQDTKEFCYKWPARYFYYDKVNIFLSAKGCKAIYKAFKLQWTGRKKKGCNKNPCSVDIWGFKVTYLSSGHFCTMEIPDVHMNEPQNWLSTPCAASR